MALPVFNRGTADELEFQLIIEAIQLKTNSFEFHFEKISAAIKKLFVSSADAFYSHLADLVKDNDSE